jgi:heme/copper-type cytochrome/quinol oxidase subunit 2
MTMPAHSAATQTMASHFDVAAVVLLIVTVVAMLVIGFLWFRAEARTGGHLHPSDGSRELRQLLALGGSVRWREFERQFAAYVASQRGRVD